MTITIEHVDAILSAADAGAAAAKPLADMLDRDGDWDWSDGSEHGPEDRLAVVRASDSYLLVYRGSESDEVTHYETADEAMSALRDLAAMIVG